MKHRYMRDKDATIFVSLDEVESLVEQLRAGTITPDDLLTEAEDALAECESHQHDKNNATR